MSRPSPRPWVNGLDIPQAANNNCDKRLIWCNSTLIVSTMCTWISRESEEANAELIVQAVNTYDAREALIRELMAALESADYAIYEAMRCGAQSVEERHEASEGRSIIAAALAKAKKVMVE